jgi:hypothetical protein
MKYLHKGHKINIGFVKMILQYPHLKHKMLAGFLDSLCNTQMLGIKYACSMKKMMMIKNRKLEKKKLIVINNRKINLQQDFFNLKNSKEKEMLAFCSQNM